MNFKDRHTNAFTIWEAIVAMIITSFIVTISYKVYLTATSSLLQDSKNQDALHEILKLKKELYRFIQCSDYIHVKESIVVIESENPCFLEFRDSILSLTKWDENIITDYKINGYKLTFINDSSDILNAIELNIVRNSVCYNLTFKKLYSKYYLYKLKQYEYYNYQFDKEKVR